eukprot:TRINITY_DN12137_c0_g1_i1.p1 TRINITY_DN12137_c0_g1~~TRINITY_DN12137_c0_g1_i1.p1  ORF type:complete len:346 (+),score=25.10 TRINITY_DN12137_c0_g1_i1:485-1522(+)
MFLSGWIKYFLLLLVFVLLSLYVQFNYMPEFLVEDQIPPYTTFFLSNSSPGPFTRPSSSPSSGLAPSVPSRPSSPLALTNRSEPLHYWELKLMDYVAIDRMDVVKFDSRKFVKKFSGGYYSLPNNHHRYASFSGSMVTLPSEGIYIHFSRVVQSMCSRLSRWDKVIPIICLWSIKRSVVFAEILDLNFTQIRRKYQGKWYPRIIEIPAADRQFKIGPEDSRAIVDPWGNIILTFKQANMSDSLFPIVSYNYNLTTGQLRQLTHPFGKGIQKNWSPVYVDGVLRYGCSWYPILIMDCNNDNESQIRCKKTSNQSLRVTRFRGGSALIQYRSYYVGMFRTKGLGWQF